MMLGLGLGLGLGLESHCIGLDMCGLVNITDDDAMTRTLTP